MARETLFVTTQGLGSTTLTAHTLLRLGLTATTNTELATLAEAMEGAAAGYGLANASYDSVKF